MLSSEVSFNNIRLLVAVRTSTLHCRVEFFLEGVLLTEQESRVLTAFYTFICS